MCKGLHIAAFINIRIILDSPLFLYYIYFSCVDDILGIAIVFSPLTFHCIFLV